MTIAAIIINAAAFALAATVTAIAHKKTPPDFWGRRLGRTRARRANLPVAGTVLVVLAAFFPGASGTLIAAGVAMGAAAVAGRFIDPLPRA